MAFELLDVTQTAYFMGLPSVKQVWEGAFVPEGRFRLACRRKGEWVVTEEVDASEVQWRRLDANDRIVLP